MKKGLIVVESPTKVRTIKKVVGSDYEVCASVGHVKDLPKSRLGVDVENGFEPEYEIIRGKKKVLEEIRKLARKVNEVYLGPDPDREGEAIAWHIAEELRPLGKPVRRLLLYELTARGIREALQNPADLDERKYEAQRARRVLDRLVGYHLSPLLWEKVKRGLSAGRVQSVALRLICEREAEIRAFRPEEYWTIEAELRTLRGEDFLARLEKKEGRKLRPRSREETEAVLGELERVVAEEGLQVASLRRREVLRKTPPPFITSTLQQEAFRRFRFPARKTMYLAQRLYEGVEIPGEGPVGLITYMRTDSVRVAREAQEAARRIVENAFGRDFLPERPPEYRSRATAQEAHEAIRPTRFDLPPERLRGVLDPDAWKLYDLIWRRFLASQMTPARYETTVVEIVAGPYGFVARGRRLLHPGFLAVYAVPEEDQLLPGLEEGQRVELRKLLPRQHFTKPPARYTEATLIRTLEEKGIGRPSTYAQIVSTIRERGYVESVAGTLRPTELGLLVNELLVKSFPELMDPGFTARMEAFLDEIAEGRAERHRVLAGFYRDLLRDLRAAEENMASLKAGLPSGVRCPECGAEMLLRVGRAGPFLACSRYPDCRVTGDYERDGEGKLRLVRREAESRGSCPECGGDLVLRKGRFGEFLACVNYPDCRYTRPVGTGLSCPREGCDGEIVKRRSRRGRTFYACSRAPDCDFVLWDEPVPGECPSCGAPFTALRVGKRPGRYCPFCKATFAEEA
ncbi:type I DNA topoisomerase [Thermosulfurimonas sp. F29]|uniref:type I DNA topoisomerase n=1 Tax=Thermosulfurimonas sp. F29 TaxID=2867247 RepID=UPI001C83EBEB|nr:type I DNA topoisomerase [Thermosulfurimonas sp. F29]MBX6422865.1 type I DNA topoisomerase [Thermosulfurimonas sp. F29]